ncbi:unnamed protein product [Dovyalis caffra]|uniref:Uncharacterized protein n=1 Tax=Dovyalis caffra TaxID=77055 RepID=A0AAV1R6M6_9ROSI|nr:unnamed protein product [Dovyalis caffra]
MICAKKLIKLARKWQILAAIEPKRLTWPQIISSLDSDDCSTSSTAEKGHFVVYTTDENRFLLPLDYLKNEIVRELFNLAEEEFGLTNNGPLTLPCDAAFMQYAIALIQQNVAKDIEKALLITIASNGCSSSLYPRHQETQDNITMINPMKLIKFAKKWQKLAALESKRISIQRSGEDENTNNNDKSPVADKGHFVVYTVDQRRFEFPISYLNNNIFRELLEMSEEEFGLPRNGPITLLCDAMFMEYAASLMQQNVDKDMEKALLMSIASSSSSKCSLSFRSLHQEQSSQQLLVC